jgi:hypothetical protein
MLQYYINDTTPTPLLINCCAKLDFCQHSMHNIYFYSVSNIASRPGRSVLTENSVRFFGFFDNSGNKK